MYADLVIGVDALDELFGAVLARIEGIASSDPNIGPRILRKVCSWSPRQPDATLRGGIQEINVHPPIEIKEREFNPDAGRSAIQIPNGPSTLPIGPTAEGRVAVVLEAAVATAAALRGAGLNPAATDLVRLTLTYGITTAITRGPQGASLTLAFRFVGIFTTLPLDDDTRAALSEGFSFPIPLGNLERSLGGVRFIASAVRTFGAEDTPPAAQLAVIRLVFVPVAELTPEGDAARQLLTVLAGEHSGLEFQSLRRYQAILDGESMAISIPPASWGQIFLSTVQRAITGTEISVRTRRADVTLAAVQDPRRLGFRCDFDLFARGLCRSWPGPGPSSELGGFDLPSTATASVRVANGELVTNVRLEPGLSFGSVFGCLYAQAGEALTGRLDRFLALGIPALILSLPLINLIAAGVAWGIGKQ